MRQLLGFSIIVDREEEPTKKGKILLDAADSLTYYSKGIVKIVGDKVKASLTGKRVLFHKENTVSIKNTDLEVTLKDPVLILESSILAILDRFKVGDKVNIKKEVLKRESIINGIITSVNDNKVELEVTTLINPSDILQHTIKIKDTYINKGVKGVLLVNEEDLNLGYKY